jgi:HD-like signal output (HDOD) protein
MANFFTKLFRREASLARTPAPGQAVRVQPASAPPAAAQAQLPAPGIGAEGFEKVWALLTAGSAPASALAPDAQEMVDFLVPKVKEMFRQLRPDPASFPTMALQILDLINDPDLDMNELIRAISPDPAIPIYVLRAANSAMVSRGSEIQDLRRAVLQLGTREVGVIAAGVASKSLYDPFLKAEFEVFGRRWNLMFQNSMAVAMGASQFAFEQQVGRADHAFLAGMFHDIGKTLALRSLARLVLNAEVVPPLPDPVVDEVLEQVHLELGCDLHHLWGLPEYLVNVCQHHHDPEVPPALENMDLHVLRLAEGLHRLVLDPADAARLEETRQSFQSLQLTPRNLQRVWTDMGLQHERVAALFA